MEPYLIEDFEPYQLEPLNENWAVLTWRKGVGYQFMPATAVTKDHRVVGVRKN